MSFLAKGKKVDLQNLVIELGLETEGNKRVIELHGLILKNDVYKEDEEFVKGLLESTISARLEGEANRREVEKREKEKEEQQEKEREQSFELQKLRL